MRPVGGRAPGGRGRHAERIRRSQEGVRRHEGRQRGGIHMEVAKPVAPPLPRLDRDVLAAVLRARATSGGPVPLEHVPGVRPHGASIYA